ncbi:alpha/beta fold hydrolase [Paenibacillus sp. GYB003]|uniref:alpha/beta fold hydrolase n=1 Tax=Paenibacillus sp. GYB003 TaxID=2994392 RepID=UPI002F962CF5
MEKAFVNGVTICYDTVGEGFPLIGITGKDSNMDWWHPAVKQAFSENHRFIMLDNRGSGRSDAPTEPYGISDMAKDVVGLMDVLGIEKAHLFGQSMGGMIAQEIAIEHPERVAKLILCGTTCGVTRVLPSFRMIRWLMRKSTGFSPQDTLDMLFSKSYMRRHPDMIASLVERMEQAPPNPVSVQMHKQASRSFDSFDRLGRIKAPTLIIHGKDDWVFRAKHAKLLNRRIAGSELVLIPGAGHGVFSQERSTVLAEIRRFLNR